MEPHINASSEGEIKAPHPVNQITPVSKYLALALFIILPFVGGYIGYKLAQEKTSEIEVNEAENSNVPILTNEETTGEVPVVPAAVGAPSVIPELKMYFNVEPETDELRKGALNIQTEGGVTSKTFEVTGYIVKSTKTGKKFTIPTVALSGEGKYGGGCQPKPSGPTPVRFDEGQSNIVIITSNSTQPDCEEGAEGMVFYKLNSKETIWDTAGDTIELYNLQGVLVASYSF